MKPRLLRQNRDECEVRALKLLLALCRHQRGRFGANSTQPARPWYTLKHCPTDVGLPAVIFGTGGGDWMTRLGGVADDPPVEQRSPANIRTARQVERRATDDVSGPRGDGSSEAGGRRDGGA